ncbi:hypothetical protein At1D1460_46740 (plasmid) [Agrobacterium tumefaciens]|nr:hypothetical protein At1D1460_46740 [Agrobacterium tumefaciens]
MIHGRCRANAATDIRAAYGSGCACSGRVNPGESYGTGADRDPPTLRRDGAFGWKAAFAVIAKWSNSSRVSSKLAYRCCWMIIREERPSDDEKINELTVRAFAPMAFSDGTEAQIIRSLRQSGELTISLVAEEDDGIVGHVAFSPVTINGSHGGWFGLGPISVEPERQRAGIGKSLIFTGFDALRQREAVGVALIGNPKIYSRVGFESDGYLTYKDLEARIVQRILFSGKAPMGELRFASAFEAS